MEIRAIDNSQRQNFCALKIEKGAEKILKEMSLEELGKLEKIGKEFRDYRHCDLFISSQGEFIASPRFSMNRKFTLPVNYLKRGAKEIHAITSGDYVRVELTYMPDRYIPISDAEERKHLINVINGPRESLLTQAADIVRILEKKFETDWPARLTNKKIETVANKGSKTPLAEKIANIMQEYEY